MKQSITRPNSNRWVCPFAKHISSRKRLFKLIISVCAGCCCKRMHLSFCSFCIFLPVYSIYCDWSSGQINRTVLPDIGIKNWWLLCVSGPEKCGTQITRQSCDNYVSQWWVEFDDELSWLFTYRFRAFYLICRKEPNPSQNLFYSHSLNFHLSGTVVPWPTL